MCDIELDGGGSLTVSVLPAGGRAMYETSFEPFIGDSENPPLDEAVQGLGDKAGSQGDDEIMVLKDDVLFDIFYIEFGRRGKADVIRYLAERVLGKLPCLASGCPDLPLPPMPTMGPEASSQGGPPVIDPGALPSTGAQARVVNMYTENGQPVELDVYAYAWSDGGMGELGALVATGPTARPVRGSTLASCRRLSARSSQQGLRSSATGNTKTASPASGSSLGPGP